MSLENLLEIYPKDNRHRAFTQAKKDVLTEIARANGLTTIKAAQFKSVRALKNSGVIPESGPIDQGVIDFWLAEVDQQPYTEEERVIAAFDALTHKQADGLEFFLTSGKLFKPYVRRALVDRGLVCRNDKGLSPCDHVAELWQDSKRRHLFLNYQEQVKVLPPDFGKNRWNALGDLIHWDVPRTQLRVIKTWCDDPSISDAVLAGKVQRLTQALVREELVA